MFCDVSEPCTTSATFLGSISAKLPKNTCPGGGSRHMVSYSRKVSITGSNLPKNPIFRVHYFVLSLRVTGNVLRHLHSFHPLVDIPQIIFPVTFAEGYALFSTQSTWLRPSDIGPHQRPTPIGQYCNNSTSRAASFIRLSITSGTSVDKNWRCYQFRIRGSYNVRISQPTAFCIIWPTCRADEYYKSHGNRHPHWYYNSTDATDLVRASFARCRFPGVSYFCQSRTHTWMTLTLTLPETIHGHECVCEVWCRSAQPFGRPYGI